MSVNASKKISKEEVELETLKSFLKNRELLFDSLFVDSNKSEPTDIRYNGVNYQITIGDKEQVQRMRKLMSKELIVVEIRNFANIPDLLLSGALQKKATRSDKNTILLIEASSTGGLDWPTLQAEVSKYASGRAELCSGWKEIYLVFKDKNLRVN